MYFCDMAEMHACPPILTHGSRYSIFAKEKKYESALNEATKLIEIDSTVAAYHNNRGYIKTQLKQFKESLADLDKAILLDSNLAYAHNNKAYALLNLKEGS
jgi:tetratricopeptide (TPR) repeat protein